MAQKNNDFDFKAWYNQILAERYRMEQELNRIDKLVDVLANFMNEQESRSVTDGFVLPDVMKSDFEQLTTINKKIQLLYFLLDVIRLFSAETNQDRRHGLIGEKAAELLNADRAALFLIDSINNELCAKISDGIGVRESRFRKDLGMVGFAATSGRTLNVPDTDKDTHFNAEIDEKPIYQVKNALVTPIRDNSGQIFGVLEVVNKIEGRFTPDDEYLLQAYAAQASLNLKNTSPGPGAPPLVSNPILLIMKALSSGLGIDNLLQSLMKKTTQVMNADRSTLFLIDFDKREIWSKVAEGTGLSEIRFPLGVGIAGYVVATGDIVNIPDAYQDNRFNQEIDARTGYHTQTVLCAPLKDEGSKVIGVLQVLNKKSGPFSADDEKLLASFATQVGKVVKSSQLVLNLLGILENERANNK